MKTNDSLYVADIIYGTTADGPGLRNSLYVSGCNIHCPGCHNSHWWPLKSGIKTSLSDIYNRLKQDGYDISILGGEPLMQAGAVTELCKKIKRYRPDANIWLYTGYDKAYIEVWYPELMEYLDAVVDGPFIKELADSELKFRGSSNQHIWGINHISTGSEFILIE